MTIIHCSAEKKSSRGATTPTTSCAKEPAVDQQHGVPVDLMALAFMSAAAASSKSHHRQPPQHHNGRLQPAQQAHQQEEEEAVGQLVHAFLSSVTGQLLAAGGHGHGEQGLLICGNYKLFNHLINKKILIN
jgi:thioredoxin-like negative regulator of GroEL